MAYPPHLPPFQLENLMSSIKDYQITHGSQLKLIATNNHHTVQSHPVGTTLFPTLFPKSLFDEAMALQTTFNKLYATMAEDDKWLFQVLGPLIDSDPLASKLWAIYQEVKREGCVQDLTLGIFRSDYMLHLPSSSQSDRPVRLELKQVELNTISCAGGVHGNTVSNMHRHLHRSGAYESPSTSINLTASMLPPNDNIRSITAGLAAAHRIYSSTMFPTKETCILMIVQSPNFNIADERPIEYALWDDSIPCYRVAFNRDVLSQTSLSLNRELIYQPPNRMAPMEVSVVYYRSGFEVKEYDDAGCMARLQLECSRAIKCPSILGHLSTFKKVQQALTEAGVLEKFLIPEESRAVEETFMKMWPLDESPDGLQARKVVANIDTAQNYILKPSLEGGGHNIYGSDIVPFMKATPKELWHTYILMSKIRPPPLQNTMIGPTRLYAGPVISELGVFGIFLWRRAQKGGRAEIVHELDPCWSFKTKSADVDEMSVVKGYGCFDSPALVDTEIFGATVDCGVRSLRAFESMAFSL